MYIRRVLGDNQCSGLGRVIAGTARRFMERYSTFPSGITGCYCCCYGCRSSCCCCCCRCPWRLIRDAMVVGDVEEDRKAFSAFLQIYQCLASTLKIYEYITRECVHICISFCPRIYMCIYRYMGLLICTALAMHTIWPI